LPKAGNIVGERGERELRGTDAEARVLEALDHAGPARPIGPRPVDENDVRTATHVPDASCAADESSDPSETLARLPSPTVIAGGGSPHRSIAPFLVWADAGRRPMLVASHGDSADSRERGARHRDGSCGVASGARGRDRG